MNFFKPINDVKKPNRYSKSSLNSFIISLIIFIHALTTSELFATPAPTKISFQRILEKFDVAIGSVEAIIQDHQGYMWFGGENGLLRYDGYTMLLMAQPDSTGQQVRDIYYLLVDSRGILWISTGSGLVRYYAEEERFVRYDSREGSAIKLSDAQVKHGVELPSGELAFATGGGVTIMNVEQSTSRFLKHDDKDENSLLSDHLWAIAADHSGNLWIGGNKGLDYLNVATGELTHYRGGGQSENRLTSDQILVITVTAQGDVWIGTSSGLNRLDPRTGRVTRFINEKDNPPSLSANGIRSIHQDSRGAIWIGTDGGGLNYYDAERNEFKNFKMIPGAPDSINSNVVRKIFEDRNGDLWTGNFPTGINFYDRSTAASTIYTSNPSDPKSLSHNAITSIAPDGKDGYWLGALAEGINYFDRKNNTFVHYRNDPNDLNSLSTNSGTRTFVDSKGIVWIGTWGGSLNRFDTATGIFTRYPTAAVTPGVSQSQKLNSVNVRLIKEDHFGNLWLGTQGGGLNKLDLQTGMFTHYTPDPNNSQTLLDNLIYSMYEDSKGRIWTGTRFSLELMDRENGTFTHFLKVENDPTSLSSGTIFSILEDSKGRLWFGSSDGLNLLQEDEKTFRHFGKNEGFNNLVIRSIIEGSDHQLWLGTGNGITSFNPDTLAVKNYNKSAGWQRGNFNPGAAAVGDHGQLYFGGDNGLTEINLNELKVNTTPPPIVITDFKIFTDSIGINGPDKLLRKAIDHSQVITLNYKQTMFSFEFSALNFRDSAKNQYAYRLEGFDKEWRNVGTQRYATFTNIDPGEYVFRVKGSNNDGVWNDEGTSIRVIQLPPPWRTWWAYTLYACAFIGLISWLFWQQRRKRQLVEQQNVLLEIKVAERTAEVVEKSRDMHTMLSNIPQGLFTVQADGFIHPEYSAYLENIFETTNIAGRNVSEFLFTRAKITNDTADSANAALFSILGEDAMNFDFNESLLINEYEIEINSRIKILALSWSPIIDGDIVTKLMVSIRDVTQIKQMENSARAQQRQLDIISQLLGLSAEKYLEFEESSNHYLKLCREALAGSPKPNQQITALLFRNIHTVKGNSRTFGFTHLSNAAHDIESIYSQLTGADDEWDAENLTHILEPLQNVLDEYAHIFRTVLGREQNTSIRRTDGFWLDNIALETIRNYIESADLEGAKAYVNQLNTLSLEDTLADIISAIPSVAEQLGKLPPKVIFEPFGIKLKIEAQKVMQDVFSHVIRNCLDHGLESTEMRIAAGKPDQGTISIRADYDQNKLKLFVKDDGRGLNISRLFKKGVELKKWAGNDKPNIAEIADLIFHSGVTTKETVTDISGRGVGMDAVKQFMLDCGGDVFLALDLTNKNSGDYVAFEIGIVLPEKMFIHLSINQGN